ncbi:MAG: ATP-dependent Clp protease adaptor ClpS [Bacteroidales bacterium]|nr:ATP-dependent Clp protease adaptor ClpS [Bacteroidales bacterium]
MEQQQTSSKISTRFRKRKPPVYDVIIHNDDYTTMDFVVMILETIFNKNRDEAMQLMLHVHENGEAVVGTYIYDVAQSKADKATSMARAEGFPLQLTVNQKI